MGLSTGKLTSGQLAPSELGSQKIIEDSEKEREKERERKAEREREGNRERDRDPAR